jgi:hypothetical protein
MGVAFAEYKRHLPTRTADFPSADIVRAPDRVSYYRQQNPLCSFCEAPRAEVHHIIGGAGRSDEWCNFLSVCRRCHGQIVGRAGLAKVLFAKWSDDPLATDWVRLAILYRQFLPRPEPLGTE